MHILVTGGCGFIGSNFLHLIRRERPDWTLTNLDALTYAGNPENLTALEGNDRYRFIHGTICGRETVERAMEGVDHVVHFAAESHVDRSIEGPEVFVQTNVSGTLVLLEAARKKEVKRFLHVSTDEVYGSLGPEGLFSESTPIAPNSPYSASKASSDLLVAAYRETYQLDTIITRCSNNYGPYQYPEKLIPLLISNLLDGQSIPIYGDGLNVRDWLHVEDHCRGILLALEKGESGEVYNIGGNNEKTNLEIAKLLISALNRDESSIEFVEDRKGHDRRYAIDASKITQELGWEPRYLFDQGIRETIEWYQQNETWWRPLKKKRS